MWLSCISGVRIYGPAVRNRWTGRNCAAAVSVESASECVVLILWTAKGPDQGAVLGRGRFFAGVQAAGGGEFSMAAEWNRDKADYGTAVPVAHGGGERGTAQGEPSGDRAAASMKCGKSLKALDFCLNL
mgnify:CR=1 FL=1